MFSEKMEFNFFFTFENFKKKAKKNKQKTPPKRH